MGNHDYPGSLGAAENTATDFAPVVGLTASGDFAAGITQTFAFDDLCIKMAMLPDRTRGEGSGGEGTRF